MRLTGKGLSIPEKIGSVLKSRLTNKGIHLALRSKLANLTLLES